MKDFLMGLVAGLLLAATTAWYWFVGRQAPAVQEAQVKVATKLEQMAEKMDAKLMAFELRGADIKEDLGHTGQVVRRSVRAFGANVADATADARITASIKAKLVTDPELSAWKIAVSTTEGHVTLSGLVASHDQIGRAMLLAMETAGVQEVASTLRVKE